MESYSSGVIDFPKMTQMCGKRVGEFDSHTCLQNNCVLINFFKAKQSKSMSYITLLEFIRKK